MKRAHSAALLAAALLAIGCNREPKASPDATIEEPPGLAGIVHVADPGLAGQLLNGFYDIEQSSWRWTKRDFTVALRRPAAVENGARLEVKLSVPDPVIAKAGPVTLTARIGATALPPETFRKPGDYVFTRDVPPAALAASPVIVDFALDKVMPPDGAELRELGVIVSSIGLESR